VGRQGTCDKKWKSVLYDYQKRIRSPTVGKDYNYGYSILKQLDIKK